MLMNWNHRRKKENASRDDMIHSVAAFGIRFDRIRKASLVCVACFQRN